MVAVVHQSSTLSRMISYNEHKVKAGLAHCLLAAGFIKNAADLSFSEKLHRFEKLTSLNQRTRVNALHISLNFDPSEKLPDERLCAIASAYLARIGFAEQPYLVYRHQDAGHPHIHLVTTNIKPDGKAITLHNLVKNKSEPARLELESRFGLVPAQGRQQRAPLLPEPVHAARVIYGKHETKKAVARVLNFVLNAYAFSSLPELNAVLGLYNVIADPGANDSRVAAHEGLLFRVLDEAGHKVGPPLKASLFAARPTRKNLGERFAANAAKKRGKEARLRTAIDLALPGHPMHLGAWVAALKKDGIDVVLRQNDRALIYGMTYVDHVHKVVLNGSDLGKGYSAKAILERLAKPAAGRQTFRGSPGQRQRPVQGKIEGPAGGKKATDGTAPVLLLPGVQGLAEALLQPEYQPEQMDWQLKRKHRKRKRLRTD